MITLPLNTFQVNKNASSVQYSSIGTVFLDGIPLRPPNDSTPVLESAPVIEKSQTVRFTLNGKIALPVANECRWIIFSGTIEACRTDKLFFQIEKCHAVSPLSDFAFDQGVILTSGVAALTTCRYHAHVRLTGNLRIRTDDSVEAEAIIDAPIQYIPDTTEACWISTLLSDATVRINENIVLRQGTIRFEISSTPQAVEAIQRQFDEDDELLYQFEDTVIIGNFKIVPIPEKPITMAVALLQNRQNGFHLHLTVYPARIRCNFIGDKTILFIHGDHYNEPFTIDTSGRWQASVSSNIFLQLIAPEDPSDKPLLEAGTPVLGHFSATGLEQPYLAVHAAMSGGTLLPESNYPYRFCNREISIDINEDDSARCRFTIEELPLENDTCVRSAENDSSSLHIGISRNGLRIKNAVMYSDTSETTEQKCSLIIHGDGYVSSFCN